LGPRVETVFRKCRLDGLGQAMIARELGVSLSSVEKDLQKAYRALAQLRAKFDAE
jgi:RNA polymerase sigma-70 factor (ECF subfamily)